MQFHHKFTEEPTQAHREWTAVTDNNNNREKPQSKVKNEQLKQMHSSLLVLNLNMVFYNNN